MQSIVRADRVEKRFGRIVALAGVSLEIASGIIYALLGPNGAGKTTLIRVLATLLKPDGGSATVAGIDVVRDPTAVRRGRVPDRPRGGRDGGPARRPVSR